MSSSFVFDGNKHVAAVLALLLIAAAQTATAARGDSSVNLQASQNPFELKLDFNGPQFRLTYIPNTGIYNYEQVYLYNGLASQFPCIPMVANVTIKAPFEGDTVTQSFNSDCSGSSPVDYESYGVLFSKQQVTTMTSRVTTTIVCGYDYSSTCDSTFPCLNGGQCSSSTKQCSCPAGFFGNKCEIVVRVEISVRVILMHSVIRDHSQAIPARMEVNFKQSRPPSTSVFAWEGLLVPTANTKSNPPRILVPVAPARIKGYANRSIVPDTCATASLAFQAHIAKRRLWSMRARRAHA